MRKPITPVVGNILCSNSICLLANPLTRKATPVMLSPRPIEACDNPEFDRVAAHSENDRDRPRYDCLGFDDGNRTTGCDQHIHIAGNQISSERRQSIKVALCEARFNPDVLAFGEPSLLQTLSKRSDDVRGITGGSTTEIANDQISRLLRPRRERPYRRHATEKCNDLAPPHSCTQTPDSALYSIERVL